MTMQESPPAAAGPSYAVTDGGECVVTHYNQAKPFSSFLPGVAGLRGIPMWVFYVNRGQCVCSMGVQDKDHPLMEFLPANWAYQLVSSQGFRTFVKVLHEDGSTFYEPFQDRLADRQVRRTQQLTIAPAHLRLDEANETLGLDFSVEYFNVPDDDYAGLVRTLTLRNRNPHPVTLEGLDGLPLLVPYGVGNHNLKHMRRLVEAFVEVSNYERSAPYFRAKVEPADRPDVVRIQKGHFYVGFESGPSGTTLVVPIVDPQRIFGRRGDYEVPDGFLTRPWDELKNGQVFENRLPCAMGAFCTRLLPGESYTYVSVVGHAATVDELNARLPTLATREYVAGKAKRNKEIVEALTQHNWVCSAEPTFDHYTRQNFLDNVLRGGFPLTVQGSTTNETFHVYSRKHGDLERDYNDFRLAPTFYSQGNGNFRDVNQNRRCDLYFNPNVHDGNVEHFYNLIQLDGFNPLVIKGVQFVVREREMLPALLERHFPPEAVEGVRALLDEAFSPGELVTSLHRKGLGPAGDPGPFLGELLGLSERSYATEYGEGFWTDHWSYNLDLLENYLAVYPEKLRFVLFEKKSFGFFDNPHRVRPRDEKYVLWEQKPMQLEAVAFDEEKAAVIAARTRDPNRVRTQGGKGELYRTSLVVTLVCLIVNKLSSLDPEGVGVEMEAGKPNWYDALNGLPGLLGSSVSETLEVKRHAVFVLGALDACCTDGDRVAVFEELGEFTAALQGLLAQRPPPFEFWDRASTARERYREKTRLGLTGREEEVPVGELKAFLRAALERLEEAVGKSLRGTGEIPSTYFVNRVVAYEQLEETGAEGERRVKRNAKGLPCFRPTRFEHVPLPLFLEGPVHYLRCKPGMAAARSLAAKLRESGLYDRKLKMFKVNESLEDQPMEIGRARTFSPGWFENESIWLHMEYKYLVELVRNQLFEEFYDNARNVLVPFFDPEVYGRSVLENSSFLVSSANPDPSLHGNGFVARLSGATAEFIHLLALLTVGEKPFRLGPGGELQLVFAPALAKWLFTTRVETRRLFLDGGWREVELPANTFSFLFLGKTLVTYHNEHRKDTYGPEAVAPSQWLVDEGGGASRSFGGPAGDGDLAARVRAGKVRRIHIWLS